jgi:23S rRNA (uracil1939-C5)-methyltransferase
MIKIVICIPIPHTTHVETVVVLSHKNVNTYINENVELGEGDGKIPVDKIAQKAKLM